MADKKSFALIKAFAVRFFLDILSRAVVFVLSILVARKLLVSEYGQFAYALSLANLFYVFTEMGLHVLLLRDVDHDPEKMRVLWQRYFTLKLSLSLITLIAGLLLFPVIWPWKFSVIFLASLGWMLGNSLLDFYQSACNALHRFDLAGIILLTYRALLLAATAVLFWRGEVTLGSVLLVFLLCNLAASVFSIPLIKKFMNIPSMALTSAGDAWNLLKESLPIGLANILGMVYMRFDMLFLGWMRSTTELGYYGAAYRIYEVVFVIPAALMSIAIPVLSRARSESLSSMRNEMKKISLILSVIALSWIVVGFFNARWFIELLFGSKYASADTVLRILVLANVVVFLNHIVIYTLIVLGHQKKHVINQAVCFVFCLSSVFFLIRFWGSTGAAITTLSTQLLLTILTIRSLWPFLWERK